MKARVELVDSLVDLCDPKSIDDKQSLRGHIERLLTGWREPERKPGFCKNCPHADFLHPTPYCDKFEPMEEP